MRNTLSRLTLVPGQPTKVSLAYKRSGVECALVMRSDLAMKLIPTEFHLSPAPYLEPFTTIVLKKMPHGAEPLWEMILSVVRRHSNS